MKKIIYYILTSIMKREWLISLLSNKEEKVLLGLEKEGYLYDIGWSRSIATEMIVDRLGQPLPWVTYPFIQFIAERLNADLDIFEFGSGNSTLYYANKTASVRSVEHDEFWYNKIKNSMPSNVELFHCKLETGGDYCNYAAKTNRKYDVIIVDGRDRVNCCINSLTSLKPGGVVILDDSEREKYADGVNFLLTKGFKKIDFWGTAPAINYLKCTSVFYQGKNCLGI
jgi:hypothetical protein